MVTVGQEMDVGGIVIKTTKIQIVGVTIGIKVGGVTTKVIGGITTVTNTMKTGSQTMIIGTIIMTMIMTEITIPITTSSII